MGHKYKGRNRFVKFIVIVLLFILIHFLTTYGSPWNPVSQGNPFRCNVIAKTQPVLHDCACRLINFSFCQDLFSSFSRYLKLLLPLYSLIVVCSFTTSQRVNFFSRANLFQCNYKNKHCYVTACTRSPICHILALQFETIFFCFSLC